jgi:hypothetical protein
MGVRLACDRAGAAFSDLDLAIDAGRRLTLDEVASLAEAFSESDLPYKSMSSIGGASTSASGK